MKKLIYSMLLLSGIVCVNGQVRLTEFEWKATIKVVDERGSPVSDAEVVVSYAIPQAEGRTRDWVDLAGLTDRNGVFRTSHRDRSVSLGVQARKAGYYSARTGHEIGFSPENEPERLAPSLTVALKRSLKPIPMCAKRIRELPPVTGKAVGYDLEVGDWLSPHGKGAKTDILFTVHHDKRAENDWDFKLVVNFPNQGDGIQPFIISDVEKTSALRSPHLAPESGYQSEWVKARSRRPGQPSVYGTDESLNFFFRVRTVLDDKGNVKSANYGKIYGDFMDFQYFFNPEPNSRNVEFDPRRNVIKNLRPSEQPRNP